MPDQGFDNSISKAFEMLIHAHDGDCALLYLWSVTRNSSDAEAAALDLCMTRAQVDSSFEKLSRMGLLSSAFGVKLMPTHDDPPAHFASEPVKPTAGPIEPAKQLPEYTGEEIESFLRVDPAFVAIRDKAQAVIGKPLTRNDLGRLLGIYSHLSLPAEVIMVLLQSCEDLASGPNGSLRRPSAYDIERQAYAWAHQGIQTMEDAEVFAEKQKNLHSSIGRIRTILEIYDRKLTPSERGYISSWLDKGFDDGAISAAYELTIDKIGKRAFPYMDKILQSWHDRGLHSAEEVKTAGQKAAPQVGIPDSPGYPILEE